VADLSQKEFFYFRGIRERPFRRAVESNQSLRLGITVGTQRRAAENLFARQSFVEGEVVFEDPLLYFHHVGAGARQVPLGRHQKRFGNLAVLVKPSPVGNLGALTVKLLLVRGEKLLEAGPGCLHPLEQLRRLRPSGRRPPT
jgi:hypothetical protein